MDGHKQLGLATRKSKDVPKDSALESPLLVKKDEKWATQALFWISSLARVMETRGDPVDCGAQGILQL